MACVNGYCVADGDTCEPRFERVHAGNGFACALDEHHRRWCWGANDHHQLASSDEIQIVRATLSGDTRWDSLASGGDHACGIRNGELYCWGGNDRQQVSALVIGDVAEPLRIASPSGQPWQSVATGFNSTCGVSDRLYCWGAGDQGQLGTGSTNDVGIPAPVLSEISDWTSVSLGRNHSCAISRTGGLHCWGYNYYGEVGNNAALYGPPVMMPTAIALPGVTSVAVAAYSTCAVADGQLYCWGYVSSNVLGDPALTNTCDGPRVVPALSSGLSGWTTVSASQFMSCGLRGDEVWCWGVAVGGGGLGKGVWGGNGWGRVTLGASDVSLGWNANIDEQGDTQDVDLACIITAGKVQCWGDNRFGQLAQGGATMHSTPREIAGNHRWSALVASDNHTCGITDAGELMCWGTMLSGQTIGPVSGTTALPCGAIPGVPCTLSEPASVPFHPMADAVAVGDLHTCALLGTTITCWGGNGSNQLGVTGAGPAPVVVPGAWTKLFSIGSGGGCGEQNGETWCWGSVIAPVQPLAPDPRLDGMSGLLARHRDCSAEFDAAWSPPDLGAPVRSVR
jgi:alpha-tubulin suppressor-like RCC1 family protein